MESADTGTLSKYKKKVMRSIHEVLLLSVFAYILDIHDAYTEIVKS